LKNKSNNLFFNTKKLDNKKFKIKGVGYDRKEMQFR